MYGRHGGWWYDDYGRCYCHRRWCLLAAICTRRLQRKSWSCFYKVRYSSDLHTIFYGVCDSCKFAPAGSESKIKFHQTSYYIEVSSHYVSSIHAHFLLIKAEQWNFHCSTDLPSTATGGLPTLLHPCNIDGTLISGSVWIYVGVESARKQPDPLQTTRVGLFT